MALLSFLGRLLFVSFFVLSAWIEYNEFGVDGGPAAKTLSPKFSKFSNHFTTHTGYQLPNFEIKLLVAYAMSLKTVGSLLFLFGSPIGAFLLVNSAPAHYCSILYDFYNYDMEKKAFTELFIKFTENLALLGGLIFFIGMKTSTPRRSVKKASKSKAV